MYENELWYKIMDKGLHKTKDGIYNIFSDIPRDDIDKAIGELCDKRWISRCEYNVKRTKIGFLKWKYDTVIFYDRNAMHLRSMYRYFLKYYPELAKKFAGMKINDIQGAVGEINKYFHIKLCENRRYHYELLYHLGIDNFSTYKGEKHD